MGSITATHKKCGLGRIVIPYEYLVGMCFLFVYITHIKKKQTKKRQKNRIQSSHSSE